MERPHIEEITVTLKVNLHEAQTEESIRDIIQNVIDGEINQKVEMVELVEWAPS